MQREDMLEVLREIEYDIADVYEYLKNDALAEAWISLEEITDKIIDLINEIKQKWKENGGIKA